MADDNVNEKNESAPVPAARKPARRSPTTGHRKKKHDLKRSQSTPRELIIPTSSDDDAHIKSPRRSSLSPERSEPKKTVRRRHKTKEKQVEEIKEVESPTFTDSQIKESVMEQLLEEKIEGNETLTELKDEITKTEETESPSSPSWWSGWSLWKKKEIEPEIINVDIDAAKLEKDDDTSKDKSIEHDILLTDDELSSDFAKIVSEIEFKPFKPEMEEPSKFTAKMLFELIKVGKAEFRQFVAEMSHEIRRIKQMRNICLCKLFLFLIMCGLVSIVFKYVEGAFETFYKCGVKRVKRDFIEELWRSSHFMREDEWKSKARRKLMEFENQLQDAYEAGMTSYSGQRSWSFLNGVVFALTISSTIGYGHLVPKTTTGMILTIIYALVGVPLFLAVLTDYGKLLTRIIKFLWAFILRFYYTESMQKFRRKFHVKSKSKHKKQQTNAVKVFEINETFDLPVSVALTILFLYTLLGAITFYCLENWTLLQSIYFVFTSLVTIGFGDYVPETPVYLLILMVYVVFGLSLTSMCISVVRNKLVSSFAKATCKIGIAMGVHINLLGEDEEEAEEEKDVYKE